VNAISVGQATSGNGLLYICCSSDGAVAYICWYISNSNPAVGYIVQITFPGTVTNLTANIPLSLPSLSFKEISCDATGQNIYVGTYNSPDAQSPTIYGQIYRSTDYGTNWEYSNYNDIGHNWNSIVVSLDNTYIYASPLSGVVFISTVPQVLNVNGSILASGSVTASGFSSASDYRIKENVETLTEEYTVDKLRPVIYKNIKTNRTDIGFIAHELQQYYPYLVNGIKDGPDIQSVNYIGLIGIMVKEIQELKNELLQLEKN
jgi:hypothetical protein